MYTVRLTNGLIKNIGRVEIDNRSFNPIFVLGEETKEWLNINMIGEWRAVDPHLTSEPSIVFSHAEDYTWFVSWSLERYLKTLPHVIDAKWVTPYVDGPDVEPHYQWFLLRWS